MPLKSVFTIGEASTETGLSKKAIRLYEQVGLIRKPARGLNGYRYYDKGTLLELKKIATLRGFGLSIAECREAIQIDCCRDVLERKRCQLRSEVRALEAKIIQITNELSEQAG